MKQALLFDMDGTLIDSMPFWVNLKYDVLDYYFNRTRERITLTEEEKEKIEKLSTKNALKFINSVYKTSLSYKKDCYPLLLEFYSNQCKIKEGVIQALQYFESRGIKMAVCTATPEKLARVALRAQGIEHYFKFIMTPEKSKSSKARPIIYKMCAMKLFKRRKNIVLIDDAPYALRGAKGYGLRAVGVRDGDKIEANDCDMIFDNFYGLLDYFIKKGSF